MWETKANKNLINTMFSTVRIPPSKPVKYGLVSLMRSMFQTK